MPEDLGSNALEANRVVVGWPEIGDIIKLPKSREAIKDALAKASPGKKPKAIAIEAGAIYRFVHEIKKDDYVVYPSKHDRMVNIGRFAGTIKHIPSDKGGDDEYPTCREVKWLGHFPRSGFSQSALNEIGSFLALFKVKNHEAEILNKIEISQTNHNIIEAEETPDDDSVTGSVSKQAKDTTQDYIIKKLYNELSGHEFEDFVAHLLECMGYTARVTEMSGDGGVDVIAHKDELGFEPPIIKVQCKRITAQSGEPEVGRLLGTIGEGECALFVNLGSYSKSAKILERNRPKLRLIDGSQLVELFLEHYDRMSARYRTLIPLQKIYVADVF